MSARSISAQGATDDELPPQPHPVLNPGGVTSPLTVMLAAAGPEARPVESWTTSWNP
jgi:hypothetical protein